MYRDASNSLDVTLESLKAWRKNFPKEIYIGEYPKGKMIQTGNRQSITIPLPIDHSFIVLERARTKAKTNLTYISFVYRYSLKQTKKREIIKLAFNDWIGRYAELKASSIKANDLLDQGEDPRAVFDDFVAGITRDGTNQYLVKNLWTMVLDDFQKKQIKQSTIRTYTALFNGLEFLHDKDVRVCDSLFFQQHTISRPQKIVLGFIFKKAKTFKFISDIPEITIVKAEVKHRKCFFDKYRGTVTPFTYELAFTEWLKHIEALKDTRPDEYVIFTVLIHTALRVKEALQIKPSLIDFEHDVLTIPVTKCHENFRVPISTQLKQLLKNWIESRNLKPDDLIYRKKQRTLNQVYETVACHQYHELHGNRTAFNDFCDSIGYQNIRVRDMALDHRQGDQTFEAYNRSDLLEERREIMQKWSDFLTNSKQSS